MKRATLHIIVHSVCCAKIKGVDADPCPVVVEEESQPEPDN